MQKHKEEAARQYVEQRWKEVDAYLNGLLEKMARHRNSANRNEWLFFITWFTWVGVDILEVFTDYLYVQSELMFVLMIFMLIRKSLVIDARYKETIAEFDGAMEVLRIIGAIDKDGLKKRKQYKESVFEKFWAWTKKEKQKEAYGFASVIN